MASRLTMLEKIKEGYVVLCSRHDDEFTFVVRRLGPSVECPHCGTTVPGAELATDYYVADTDAGMPPHLTPAEA